MCHLILVLPILGLSMFRFWPLSVAVPMYVAVFVVSPVLLLFDRAGDAEARDNGR